MKKMIIIMLVCISTIATAEVSEKKNYFETLGKMFQNGSNPHVSKLIGVMWAGRCFTTENPSKPLNAAYHFKRDQTVGPIGDGVESFVAKSIWKLSEGPDYYDTRDLSEFSEGPTGGIYNEVFNLKNSVAIEYRDHSTLSRVRVSGKYLVEEISERKLIEDDYEINLRCYYFIPEYTL